MPKSCFVNHANNDRNLTTVMQNRVLKYKGHEPLKPQGEAYMQLMQRIRPYYREKPDKVFPLTYQGFLECYSGRRRTRYEQAVAELRVSALTADDAKVETFIKNEKFDWLLKGQLADPRAIQPRKPKFLAEVGRWFKPLEHIMYKDLAKRLYGPDALPCIAKGFNASETGEILRAKWERFHNPVCVSLDASRFDLHVSVDALEFTHRLYHKYCQSAQLQRYLRWTIRNHGIASCTESAYKYEVVGRRMSGDMDTALGNCVLMLCLTWNFLDQLNVKHELFDNGDDCLFICEAADVPTDKQIMDYYSDFGFVVRLEGKVSVFERIEFCQTRPVLTATGYRMVRSLSSIAKDLCNVNMATSSGSEYTAWLKAVGTCGKILNDGVPVFSSFHRMLCRHGTRSRVDRAVYFECGLTNLIRRMTYARLEITTESRMSFQRAFGLSPQRQMALEEYYDLLAGPAGKIQLHEWPLQLKEEFDSGSEWFEDACDE